MKDVESRYGCGGCWFDDSRHLFVRSTPIAILDRISLLCLPCSSMTMLSQRFPRFCPKYAVLSSTNQPYVLILLIDVLVVFGDIQIYTTGQEVFAQSRGRVGVSTSLLIVPFLWIVYICIFFCCFLSQIGLFHVSSFPFSNFSSPIITFYCLFHDC